MTTMRDVAEHADVSVATVSRVLNSNGYVKKSTKKKVLASIETLNYTPNSIARSLYKKKTHTMGLLIPDIENPFFPELFKEIEMNANNNGYNLLLYNSNYNLEREKEFINLMKSGIVDAGIIVSDTLEKEHLDNIQTPFVTLDRKISEEFSSLIVDNFKGGQLVVDYFVENGAQNILHISGPKNNDTAMERLNGYIDRMAHHELEPAVVQGKYNIKEATDIALELLSSGGSIDAIFAANDLIAIGVVKAMTKLKINYKNIGLIGFDGIHVGRAVTPEISTFKQPLDQIAEKAIDILANNQKEVIHEVYNVHLLKRET